MARRTLVPIVALVSACVVGLSLLPSLADAEYQWSGYVNSLQDAVDFLCPDNLAVVGIASDFRQVNCYAVGGGGGGGGGRCPPVGREKVWGPR